MKKIIIICFIILILVIASGIFLYQFSNKNTVSQKLTTATVATDKNIDNNISQNQTDWTFYDNGVVSFKYPLTWEAKPDEVATILEQSEGFSEFVGLFIMKDKQNFIHIDGAQNSCDSGERHVKCQNKDGHVIFTDSTDPETSAIFDQFVSTFKGNNFSGGAPIIFPTQVGRCVETVIAKLGQRLMDGRTGQDIQNSGDSIIYTDGIYGISYDQIPEIENAKVGDRVNLCLVSLPTNCPAGDDRGKRYSAENLRTKESWSLPDSEHMCGGA